MKATATLTRRGVITLPVEVHSPEREREFDEAEAALAAVLARQPRAIHNTTEVPPR
jgi:hypothetical protein